MQIRKNRFYINAKGLLLNKKMQIIEKTIEEESLSHKKYSDLTRLLKAKNSRQLKIIPA